MKRVKLGSVVIAFIVLCQWCSGSPTAPDPKPVGRMVELGGFRLHVNCTGHGKSTVAVENGLGDFSFDWVLVQSKVERFARICTYDRAGYAWSDPGPKPRTFEQINFELRQALLKLGEHPPFILVGHSYGGPVVRNFAIIYPHDVAGVVLVESAVEGQRVGIGGKATMRLGDDAKGKEIPAPRDRINESDKPVIPPDVAAFVESNTQQLDPLYKVLPPADQRLQWWAQAKLNMYDAENSQREWSSEYFAKWLSTSPKGSLGSIPLLVLTRAEGGYVEGEADVPASQLERERKEGQARLASLSSDSRQIILKGGHNMELESPLAVVSAIREMTEAVQSRHKIVE